MRNKRPLMVLGTALVLGLALVAVANALWFQTLTLHANVSTAELRVKWTGASCTENELNGTGDPFTIDGWPNPSKQVASFTKIVTADSITLTVVNGYPGYGIDCEIHPQDVGNVPVHLERWVITVDDPGTPANPDWIFECTTTSCQTRPTGPELYLPDGDPIYVQLKAGLDNTLGCQLHPGNELTESFLLGIRQPAKEHTTYIVKLSAQFNQWNESGWNGCGSPKTTPVVPVLPRNALGTPYDPVLLGIPHQ
jgi:hypothetical protein